MTKSLFLISAILVACTSVPHAIKQSSANQNTDVTIGSAADQRAFNKKARLKAEQDQQDQKMVAERRSVLGPAQSSISGSQLINARAVPQKHGQIEASAIDPNSALFMKMQEGQLFAELVDRYQAHDQWGFEARAKVFLGKFANSDRRDETMYMRGLLELAEKNYGVALSQFNLILRDHPYGKKAPSALFAKGVTYKRMNLIRESKQALSDVCQLFPGSPESLRAKAELKILR